MHPHPSRRFTAVALAGVIAMMLVSACSSPAAAPTTASESPSPEPSEEASREPTGEASLDAPSEVEAGAEYDVDWTGPDARGDYVTIVEASATEWTNEPYFYTADNDGTGSLVAPTEDGS